MERHPDLDPCAELDSVALSMVESVRHVIEDHVGSSACICGLPTRGGRRACDDLYGLLYDLRRDYPPADPAWLTDFVARWPDVWEWGDDGAGVPSTVTDFVRSAIRYDLALRVENHAWSVLDAKARQIGLPDLPPPAPPTRTDVLEALNLLNDDELRALLAAIVEAQTTGNGLLAWHGRLRAVSPRDALIVDLAGAEGHAVVLGFTTDEDGVHLQCSCGWDHNLGWSADLPVAAQAVSDHLASVGTSVSPSAPL